MSSKVAQRWSDVVRVGSCSVPDDSDAFGGSLDRGTALRSPLTFQPRLHPAQ
jgi:hypothetical protein